MEKIATGGCLSSRFSFVICSLRQRENPHFFSKRKQLLKSVFPWIIPVPPWSWVEVSGQGSSPAVPLTSSEVSLHLPLPVQPSACLTLRKVGRVLARSDVACAEFWEPGWTVISSFFNRNYWYFKECSNLLPSFCQVCRRWEICRLESESLKLEKTSKITESSHWPSTKFTLNLVPRCHFCLLNVSRDGDVPTPLGSLLLFPLFRRHFFPKKNPLQQLA